MKATSKISSLLRFSRLALLALAPAVAFANTYSFSTTGLNSLSHGTAYTWGLSPTANSDGKPLGTLKEEIQGGHRVGSATLTITGLYDWIVEPADVLYVNLLNNLKPGVGSFTYNGSASSYDTVYGKDIFNVVEKPVLVAPVAPAKVTLKKPTALVVPKAPTLTLPVCPTAPAPFTATPPAPLGPNPTTSQKNTYNTALNTYNTALKNYNAKVTTYNAAMVTYNTKLTAYNAAWAKYGTDMVTHNANLVIYNAALDAYNAAVAQYALDKAAYDAAFVAYNAALPAYKVKLTEYNRYANTQAALGFDGVPLVAVGDSIYDQAHSLLRSDDPNGPGTWSDPDGPAIKTNLVITFSLANLDLLQALLANASDTTNIGLGFGPECHFYDKGMTLRINTVPEAGATLALFGLGMLSLAGLRRFSKQAL